MLLLSLVVLVGEYRLDAQGADDAGRDADTGGAGKVLQTKWLVHVSYLFSTENDRGAINGSDLG
jgi:hypothetical protein